MSDLQDSSLEREFSLSPVKPGQPLSEDDEEILIKETRRNAKAKLLTDAEKDFVHRLISHVNQFEHQMVSIYLEPLVKFKESLLF